MERMSNKEIKKMTFSNCRMTGRDLSLLITEYIENAWWDDNVLARDYEKIRALLHLIKKCIVR